MCVKCGRSIVCTPFWYMLTRNDVRTSCVATSRAFRCVLQHQIKPRPFNDFYHQSPASVINWPKGVKLQLIHKPLAGSSNTDFNIYKYRATEKPDTPKPESMSLGRQIKMFFFIYQSPQTGTVERVVDQLSNVHAVLFIEICDRSHSQRRPSYISKNMFRYTYIYF